VVGTPGKVLGSGQIIWWAVLTKKLRGHSGKKLHWNRKIVVEWSVGVWAPRAWRQSAQIGASPGTKYKRSKSAIAVISIALTLEFLRTNLLEDPLQSLIESPGTLVTGTPFKHVKTCATNRDSRENVFDMYGVSRENLLEILAGVVIWNPISDEIWRFYLRRSNPGFRRYLPIGNH